MDLIGHLETYLGTILFGWSASPEEGIPFQVAQCAGGCDFAGRRFVDIGVFATIGLSEVPFWREDIQTNVRLELIMTMSSGPDALVVPAILQQVGRDLVRKNQPLVRGDVVTRAGKVFEGTDMTSLYAALPVCFRDGIVPFLDDAGNQRGALWLIPITEAEAGFRKRNGVSRFEQLLVERDPNLFDVRRPSVV